MYVFFLLFVSNAIYLVHLYSKYEAVYNLFDFSEVYFDRMNIYLSRSSNDPLLINKWWNTYRPAEKCDTWY